MDPLAREFPWNSTYAYAEGSPISNIDLDGLEKILATKESIKYINSFFEIVKSNEILRKQLKDPINNPELKDKIHIYFAFTNEFGSKNSNKSNGVTYKNSIVNKIIKSIDEYQNGDYATRSKYLRNNIYKDKNMFIDSALPFEEIKKSIDNGVEVYLVLLNRNNKEEKKDGTIIHEILLHLTKFENSYTDKDHIEGFGEDYYKRTNTNPYFSPEVVPENSKLGRILKIFKNEKEKKLQSN